MLRKGHEWIVCLHQAGRNCSVPVHATGQLVIPGGGIAMKKSAQSYLSVPVLFVFSFIAVCMFTLSACDDNKSSAGNIAYDVSGGSDTTSEVFGDLDEDNFTYRDIAPAVIPDALLGLEGEHAQKARDIMQDFNDLIASPDASSAPSGKSGSRATRSVEPDCYDMEVQPIYAYISGRTAA